LKTRVLILALTSYLLAESPDSLSVNIIRDNLSAESSATVFFERPVGSLLTSFENYFDYKWYESSRAILTGQNYAVENRLSWTIGSHRPEKLNWSSRAESNVYLDRRTRLGGDLENHAVLSGLSFKNDQLGEYRLLAGVRQEKRYKRSASAKTVEFFQAGDWLTHQQLIHTQVGITEDYFENWRNFRHQAATVYQHRFAENARMESQLSWLNKSYKFFTDSTGSTQQRDIMDLAWQNRFEYRIGQSSRISYVLNWKDISSTTANARVLPEMTDTTIQSTNSTLSLQNIVSFFWSSPNVQAGSGLEITTTQQRYYIDFAQNYYRLNAYATTPGWILADSTHWDFQLARLKYDTPDTNNYDDRDEVRFNTKAGLIWVDFPYARLEVTALIQLHHLVYLSSRKSGENYWNRTFGLQSLYSWSRHVWRSRLRLVLQANYYDYDYDELFTASGQPLRSFMHRSLLVEERVHRRLTGHWSVQGEFSYKWEDDGRLDWERFLEEVVAERQVQLVTFTTRYERNFWEIWMGYSHKSRTTRYLQSGPVNSNADWLGQGPVAGFEWRQTRKIGWQASLDYLKVTEGDKKYTLPRFSLRGLLRF